MSNTATVWAAGALLAAATAPWPAAAAPAASGDLAGLLKSFAQGDMIAWSDLDRHQEVKWVAPGSVMLKTPAPDGGSFARPGSALIGGQPVNVAATGARAGVTSVFLSDTNPAQPAETVAAGLRQAGLALSPIRCARDPANPDPTRGWYRMGAGKAQASLYIGRLGSGRQGYTLYLADLPPMTQAEAARFVDCPTGAATAAARAAPATGQAGVVAFIEAVLRPVGAPALLPWGAPLPGIAWHGPKPMKMSRPQFSSGGPDANPNLQEGDFTTATTKMSLTATGDPKGANRFYLEDGGNLPREAVFAALKQDGYAIAAVTCGKPYTQMSENWFRISGPGKQPAILYRLTTVSTGKPTESYGLRLDNVAPPLQPGQRAAGGGTCPG